MSRPTPDDDILTLAARLAEVQTYLASTGNRELLDRWWPNCIDPDESAIMRRVVLRRRAAEVGRVTLRDLIRHAVRKAARS